MSNVQSELDSVKQKLAGHNARLQEVRDEIKETKATNDREELKELHQKEDELLDWITELQEEKYRLGDQLGYYYLRTTAEMLNSNIPPIRWWHQAASSSTEDGLQYFVPGNVQVLKGVPGQPEWEQGVISLQNDPAVEPWAPPLVELAARFESQAGIRQALSLPLDLLTKICNRPGGELPKVGGWVAEESSNILQRAVAHHMTQHSSELPVHNGLCQQTAGSLGNGNESWRPVRREVVLVIDQEQQQPPQEQQQQPAQGQQQQLPQAQQQQAAPLKSLARGLDPLIAVGQFYIPPILACPSGPKEWTPVNLVEGFHKKDPTAVHVVCQMFTYLVLHGLQFGFISCYFWTWVLHLSKDRKTVYISAPIAHNTKSTRLKPAVTFMGAVHWVQTHVLRTYREPVDNIDVQQLMTVEQLLADHQSNQESLQRPPRDDPADPENAPATGPGRSSSGGDDQRSAKRRKGEGGASFDDQCSNPHDGSGDQLQEVMRDNEHMQLLTAPNLLQLMDLICCGSLGLVMHGSFNGHPAVIKLYGPDSDGVEACRNEAAVYGALLPLQGTVVPRLLGWGQLLAGVCYLATALVDGTPLSSLSSSQQPIAAAAAAQSALQKICSVQPGFLHGEGHWDLRLANILLLRDTQDAATPTAMFIDFATSRLNGSRAEVRGQRRQLRSLLSRIS